MTAACASRCAATSAFLPRRSAACTCAPGEGITGFAAERCVRCRSRSASRTGTSSTSRASARRSTPPCWPSRSCAAGVTAGVLVLQRGVERAFSDERGGAGDGAGAVINHAIDRGQERERRQARSSERRAVRLSGNRSSGGAAMGRAEVLPTLSGAVSRRAPAQPAAHREDRGDGRAPAGGAAQGGSGRGRRRRAASCASLALILEDWRFRGGLAQGCAAPAPLKALSELARAYARVAFTAPPSDRGRRGDHPRSRRRD